MNLHLGEIIGLIHELEKRYYQNKTLLRYNFGSVQINLDFHLTYHKKLKKTKNKIG